LKDFGKSDSRVTIPFNATTTVQVHVHGYMRSLAAHTACPPYAPPPLPPPLTPKPHEFLCVQLLNVLRLAFAMGNPKVSEPALSCLHKLVAYAYLQGETSSTGRLDDPDNVVTAAVVMTARSGDSASPAVQLHVIKALLTFVTAEYFVAHGDCLMQVWDPQHLGQLK
jgi:hypothetical protein